jgi:LacI family transcriptional regulator
MHSQRRSTIVDVAREAKVSIKTVSRVFNEASNVRPETRERVTEAATRLKYHPNVIAQGLVGRRTYMLGLFYENPSPNYIFELQRGALDRLRNERYRLVVLPIESTAAVADNVVGLVRSAALDGIILTSPSADNPVIIENLRDAQFPFVRIGAANPLETAPNNTMDDVAASRLMVEYLIGLGHLRIAVIKGDPTHPASHARTQGYQLALRKAGLQLDESLVEQGMFNFESGLAAAKRLFALDPRPTAIFAQNDDMAAGVIAAAHDQGIAVPHELSVVGFDDSAIATVVYPRLTTIHQPVRDMARAAADTLIAMLEEQPFEAAIEHPFQLVVRESAAPAPASIKPKLNASG